MDQIRPETPAKEIPAKSNKLSAATTAIVLIIIAVVVFLLPVQRSSTDDASTPTATSERLDSQALETLKSEVFKASLSLLEYQMILERLEIVQSELIFMTQRIDELYAFIYARQQNRYSY